MTAAEEVNAKSALHEGQADLTEVFGVQEVNANSTVHQGQAQVAGAKDASDETLTEPTTLKVCQ